VHLKGTSIITCYWLLSYNEFVVTPHPVASYNLVAFNFSYSVTIDPDSKVTSLNPLLYRAITTASVNKPCRLIIADKRPHPLLQVHHLPHQRCHRFKIRLPLHDAHRANPQDLVTKTGSPMLASPADRGKRRY
jgi:hypothetical protein